MKKRILSGMLLVTTLCYTLCSNVMAAERGAGEKMKPGYIDESMATEDNLIESIAEEDEQSLSEEELVAIDKEFENLEITLPEEEFEWTLEAEYGISMCASTVSYYAYTTGVSTNNYLVGDMSDVLDETFEVTKEGTETEYKFGTKMRTSFVIPGMYVTNVNGEACYGMIPQGLEYYGGYYFITAYCGDKGHCSVIYVIEASTRKYITTLTLGVATHAGGITYANGYMWICGSEGVMYYYKYSDISAAISYAKQNTSVKSLSLSQATKGRMIVKSSGEIKASSFVTTYKGYICVGEHNDNGNGTIQFYEPIPVSGGTLTSIMSIVVPTQAQGAEFYTYGGYVYMLITASPSRQKDSTVYVYRSDSTALNGTLKLKNKITMPCMVEEVVTNGAYTYFVFESCGKKYRNNTDDGGFAEYIIGKVCGFTNTFIYK